MGYRGNGISEAVLERAWTVLSVVRSSDPEEETMTRGSPYNFTVLNSLVTGHLGKRILNPKL